MKKLTDKHLLFCHRYIIHMNASRAAREAGLSPKGANRLLKDQNIRSEILALKAARRRRLRINQDRVLEEYAKLAFSDLTNHVRASRKGISLKMDTNLMDPIDTAAIQGLEETKDGVKVRLHDKKGALDMLAKHLGMVDDSMKLKGDLKVEVTNYADEEQPV